MNQTKTRIPGTPKIQANKYFMTPCFSPADKEQFCFQRLSAVRSLCHEGFRCRATRTQCGSCDANREDKEETSRFDASLPVLARAFRQHFRIRDVDRLSVGVGEN